MRISSDFVLQQALTDLRRVQTAFDRVNVQLATGERFQTAGENPQAAARALRLSQSLADYRRLVGNQDRALMALNAENTHLASVQKAFEDALNIAGNANAGLDTDMREGHAVALSGLYTHLLALANGQDGEGRYIFGGTEGTAPPFDAGTVPPTYVGDSRRRVITIAAERGLEVNDPGDAVFLPQGQNVFGLIKDLEAALSSGVGIAAAAAAAADGLEIALDKLSETRNSVAARRLEAESARQTSLAYLARSQMELAETRQVDQMAAALTLQQLLTNLEAARQSSAQVAGLSLFSFLAIS
jgi:flagellar hook-associated protein 3 FlgL